MAPLSRRVSAGAAALARVLPQIPVYAPGVRHSRSDSPDYRTLNDQIEEAR